MRILSVHRKLFVLERCPYWGGVCIGEVSVFSERCPYGEVRLYRK